MGLRLLLLGVTFGALAWGVDPFVATWKLRAPTAPLESSILRIEANGLAHRLSYRRTYAAAANIAPVVETFMTNLDGKESTAIMGNGGPGPVKMSITRIDSNHWTAAIRTGGINSSTSKVEVSGDGKVLKIQSESRTQDGKTQSATQYWDRQ